MGRSEAHLAAGGFVGGRQREKDPPDESPWLGTSLSDWIG